MIFLSVIHNECGVPLVGFFNVHLRFVLSLVRASRSFATCAQDCTQLHILKIVPFFVDLPRKIGTATIFALYDFRYFFSSLTRRLFRIQQIVRKFGKIGAATMFRTLRFFATFLFSSLTREGFRNHLVLQKVRKVVPFPHFTIFPYFFFFIS